MYTVIGGRGIWPREAALKDNLPRIRLCCVHVSDHLRPGIRSGLMRPKTHYTFPIFSHSTIDPAGGNKNKKMEPWPMNYVSRRTWIGGYEFTGLCASLAVLTSRIYRNGKMKMAMLTSSDGYPIPRFCTVRFGFVLV